MSTTASALIPAWLQDQDLGFFGTTVLPLTVGQTRGEHQTQTVG